MRITVFGASGKVGQQVVALALDKGYEVTAFTHSHQPFAAQKRLKIVTGDVGDRTDIRTALEASEAVISTLGSWHTKTKHVLTSGMESIIPAMEEQGIQRIITLTGAGALWSGDQPNTFDKLNHALLKLIAPKILLDGEIHLQLLTASELEWTCVRSPVMTGSSRSRYSLRTKLPSPFATIPRAAVAHCLVDQLEDQGHIHAAPIIRRS